MRFHWKGAVYVENSMSKILIGSVVKTAIKDIKADPERGIRNLVDMALQFSEGRFQKDFFATAQAMLQNENSAYYVLISNTVLAADADRLYTFGMNLGYNGCTVGARRIREHEKIMGCRIPWTVIMQIDPQRFDENSARYHAAIRDGKKLGIYVWMLFAEDRPGKALRLAEAHADSAFILFCEPKDLTPDLLGAASELKNLMLAVRYDENANGTYAILRDTGLLYSVWYQYGQKDTEQIVNGDLFCAAQQAFPIFTVLLPEPECPDSVRRLVRQTVRQAREEQMYRTFLWELQGDNLTVDAIISDDTCYACFDRDGFLCEWSQRVDCEHNNLLQSSLADILMSAYPRETKTEKKKTGAVK